MLHLSCWHLLDLHLSLSLSFVVQLSDSLSPSFSLSVTSSTKHFIDTCVCVCVSGDATAAVSCCHGSKNSRLLPFSSFKFSLVLHFMDSAAAAGDDWSWSPATNLNIVSQMK